jgi:hypothetical protein
MAFEIPIPGLINGAARQRNFHTLHVKIIAAILERPVIEKILAHLGLDPQPPPKGGCARRGCTSLLEPLAPSDTYRHGLRPPWHSDCGGDVSTADSERAGVRRRDRSCGAVALVHWHAACQAHCDGAPIHYERHRAPGDPRDKLLHGAGAPVGAAHARCCSPECQAHLPRALLCSVSGGVLPAGAGTGAAPAGVALRAVSANPGQHQGQP